MEISTTASSGRRSPPTNWPWTKPVPQKRTLPYAALVEAGLDTKSLLGGLKAAISSSTLAFFRGSRKDEDRKMPAKPASGRAVAFHTSPMAQGTGKPPSPESLTVSAASSLTNAHIILNYLY